MKVDGARDQVLADAALAAQQDRRAGGRDAGHRVEDLLHGRAPSDAGVLGSEAAGPARGRADDFSWPRAQEAPGASAQPEGVGRAQERSDVAPGSGKPRPRGASRKSGENAR